MPHLASTVSKIDLFEILELNDTSAVIKYNIYPGFERFVDSSHTFSFKGLFAAFPAIHNMPPGNVREVASLLDVFKKFRVDFAQFGHEINERDGIIYLDNAPAGRWITVTKDLDLDPVIHKYLAGEKCVLWEKDVKETKKAGHEVLIAKKGDLYNCSKCLYCVNWENAKLLTRMKDVIPGFKKGLSAFLKSRNALFRQTALLQNQSDTLQQRIQEKTNELEAAHSEIMELEKRSIEHRITGGFAHEMRNALAAAQIEIKCIADYKNQGRSALERLKNNTTILSKDIELLQREFNIPDKKINAYIIPQLNDIDEISNQLSEATHGISNDIDRALKITNEIRNYAKTHELTPGKNKVDIVQLVIGFKYQYKKELKLYDIKYLVSGMNSAIVKMDTIHLDSIFRNLILNAKDALVDDKTPGAQISIHTEKCGTQIKVSVKDNGPGISEDSLKEIFEPFYTTKPSSGTGLGLGMVKRLVALYDGHIETDSKIGQGTTFNIYFNRSIDK